MQIVLNQSSPSKVLRVQPLNANGKELTKDSIKPGSLVITPSVSGVGISQDANDETLVTFTRVGTDKLDLVVVATALNTEGDSVQSDELLISVEANVVEPVIAKSLLWKDKSVVVAAGAAEGVHQDLRFHD